MLRRILLLIILQPVTCIHAMEIVLMMPLFGHQEQLTALETRFNAHHKDVQLRIEYRDIHNNEVLSNLSVKQPTAILMPTDKLGIHRHKFQPLDKSWLPNPIKPKELEQVSIDGQHYGIPIISGNHLVLFYNKSLVEKPAKSWQELQEQVEALRAKDITPLGFPVDSPYYLIPFLTMFNGGLFDATGQVAINTTQNLEALHFYRSLYLKDLVLKNCGWECGKTFFHKGKVAYSIDIDAAVFTGLEALGNHFGIARLPKWKESVMSSYYANMAIFIPRQTLSFAQRKAMKRLVDFFSSMTTQKTLATEQYLMPVHYGVQRALEQHEDHIVQVLLQQLLVSKPVPNTTVMHNIWISMGKNLQPFLTGKLSPEEFLTLVQQAAAEP